MKKKQKKKIIKSINPLNAFLMLVIFSIVVGIVVIILNQHFAFDGKEKPVIEDYEIKVIIKDAAVSDYSSFHVGEEFVLSGKNVFFGEVIATPYYTENVVGFIVTFTAKGSYTADNGFLLNGDLYIAPGNVMKIHGDESSHMAEIYSIEKIK